MSSLFWHDLFTSYHLCFIYDFSFLQLWEDKEGKKKMNKNNAKALSTLRQKIRKYNRDYEAEIAAYKEVNRTCLSVILCFT